MQLFTLFGSVALDDKDAKKSLKEIDSQGVKTERSLGKSFSSMAKAGAAAGAAFAAAGTAMIGLATKAGNAADELLDLSDITGMSTDEIQRWRRVSEVAGVSATAMTDASQKLTRSMTSMGSEGNKSRQAIEQLGLSLEDIKNMNADERMDVLVKSLSEVEDETERARIGTDLFGGAWADVAPIAGMTAEELDKVKDSANVVSEEDLERANEFRVQMALLKDEVRYAAIQLGIHLLPFAEAFFELLETLLPFVGDLLVVFFEITELVISKTIEWIGSLISWLRDWYEENEEVVNSIIETFMTFFDLVIDLLKAFIDLFKSFWDTFGEHIMTVIKIVWDVVKEIIKAAFNIIEGILKIFTAIFTGDWELLWEGIKQILSAVRDALIAIVRGLMQLMLNVVKAGLELIQKAFVAVFTIIKNIVTSIIEGITNIIITMVNLLIKSINFMIKMALAPLNALIKGLNKVPGVNIPTLSMSIPEIPKLATGGLVSSATLAVIGEGADEEAVMPLNTGVYDKLAQGITRQLDNTTDGKIVSSGETKIENIFHVHATIREESDIKKVARELYGLQQQKLRPKGAF